jgi:hypothetical protein
MKTHPDAPASELTKREHYIGIIVGGLCTHPSAADPATQNRIARDAIKIADLIIRKMNADPDESLVSTRR